VVPVESVKFLKFGVWSLKFVLPLGVSERAAPRGQMILLVPDDGTFP